jgi:hypothetical protein
MGDGGDRWERPLGETAGGNRPQRGFNGGGVLRGY